MNNIKDNKLTNFDFWNQGYSTNTFFVPEKKEYPLVKKLYDFFNREEFKDKNVFEIGVYPGRFIYHFGKLGFILNGIDQVPYLDKMVDWLRNENLKMGVFFVNDIFLFSSEKKYDVVFSSGFIEHFKNYEDVINIHADFVRDGGYLYMTTPNFSGIIQKFLHNILDKENLKAHYLPSMDPDKWEEILKKKNFSIVQKGYIGGFDFWVANRNIFVKSIARIIRLLFSWRFLPNSRHYSPEVFIIAKKN